ncbi:nitrogenase component 1 [Anaeromyxobacter oryzae]|uniref:Nitrogenase n=1 Tax=Anaeromyxobacter oryzae TaxID=2918170 RepID=A0ABN6MMX5_9BACT|nr:nitrogenase component 1 [Anaeromyxobacter oryzae]BDG02387.1 nitrogenase [Anaeromyxobacter oryzae]
MTISIQQRTAPVREKRTGDIGAFAGAIGALAREGEAGLAQRVRTFAQDRPSDLQRALDLLRTIEGLGLVIHGPAGCAATLHADGPATPWIVTGLTQRDSIMGGDAKLRDAILRLRREHAPRAIAVLATPVVAINNDDLESVAAELREELNVPIAPVYTDGFRSKLGSTGHDVTVHALVKHLLPHRHGGAGDHVNLIALAEGQEELAHLRALIGEVGVAAGSFPRHAPVASLGEAVHARLSVSIDPDESEYAGEALRQLRGVPYLESPPPVGISGTTRWLARIGAATGQEAQAAAVAARHARALAGVRASLARHAGARVFVNLPASAALAAAELLRELGLSLSGLSVPSVGPRHLSRLKELAAGQPDLPVLVGEGQAFEEVNLLRSLRPALCITRGNAAVHALRLGIPVLDLQRVPLLGYAGVERVAAAIARRLANPGFARFLADGGEGSYAAGWLSKSTHWFIKHEVK